MLTHRSSAFFAGCLTLLLAAGALSVRSQETPSSGSQSPASNPPANQAVQPKKKHTRSHEKKKKGEELQATGSPTQAPAPAEGPGTQKQASGKGAKHKVKKEAAAPSGATASQAPPPSGGTAPAPGGSSQSKGLLGTLFGSGASPGTQAPAASSGQVWVNLDSGVYHKSGSRWYGKTKHGKFMSEKEAVAAGYRPAKNE
jgi:hypothetical protein